MIKFCGAGSSRNDHKRSRYGTLYTIRRTVNNAEFSITGLSCNVSGRSTTVKVDCLYATCLKHDLCNFLHTTTTREGFLTAIKYHQNYLAGLSNTNCRTACTTGIIVIGSGNTNLTVLYKSSTKACDTFSNLALVNCLVFFSSTNNGSTVLQNTKETIAINCMILDTVHDKQASGLTGSHIKSGTVSSCNYVIVRNVVFTVRITVLILCGICLIKNTLHFPTSCGIIVVVVCEKMNVISCDISSCKVVYHLLVIGRSSIMNCLRDTGSEFYIFRRECLEIIILMVSNIVTCERTYVIRKCIACCTSESYDILSTGKISCSFKCHNELIRKIFIINCISYLCASTVCLKSISHEVCSTVFVCEILSHIVHEDISQRIEAFFNTVINRLKHVHDVVSIKVAVIVLLVKAGKTGICGGLTEIIFTDSSNHILEFIVYTVVSDNLKKVNKVACPTGNVSMVEAELVVVSNIHRTEDMSDISQITVRKLEVLKVLQTCNLEIIAVFDLRIKCIFSIGYIFCKICILVTCHNTPRSGVITLNAGTDILDDKIYRIL